MRDPAVLAAITAAIAAVRDTEQTETVREAGSDLFVKVVGGLMIAILAGSFAFVWNEYGRNNDQDAAITRQADQITLYRLQLDEQRGALDTTQDAVIAIDKRLVRLETLDEERRLQIERIAASAEAISGDVISLRASLAATDLRGLAD